MVKGSPAAFLVVIPSYQAAAHLGRALASLLELQPGPFDLRVHAQDGGSTDGTLEVVELWRRRIERGEVPDARRRRLTVESRRDAGLYDAVARAFDACAPDPDDVITWLGSDDVLVPGALAAVHAALARFPELRWVTGTPQVADESGAWFTPWRVSGYARRDLRAGLHEGRVLPFVMQEGTFWRASLYGEAGGLRRDLRLAGDFDLWRRFARTDELAMFAAPLAVWTRRSGQASGDVGGYQAEVDRVLADDPPEAPDAVLSDEEPAHRRRLIRLERFPGGELQLIHTDALPLLGLDGLETDASHGAAPAVRVRGRARLRLPLLSPGRYRVALRFRCGAGRVHLRIGSSDQVLCEAMLEGGWPRRPRVIAFEAAFPEGEPALTIEAREGVGVVARLLRGAPAGALPEVWLEDVHFSRVHARVLGARPSCPYPQASLSSAGRAP